MTGSPTHRERTGLGLGRLPLLLSVVAGLTDVTTFILLGGVFSAHITGNIVVLGADIATGRSISPTTVLAVPFFIITAAVVTAAVARSQRAPAWWVAPLVIAQCVFLIAAGVTSMVFRVSEHLDGLVALGTGLLAVAAMAVQNALLHVVFAKTPSTAVMTGNVVEATVSGVRVLVGRPGTTAEDRETLRRTWPLIVGFVAGCLVGGLACGLLRDLGWLVAIAAAVAVAGRYGSHRVG